MYLEHSKVNFLNTVEALFLVILGNFTYLLDIGVSSYDTSLMMSDVYSMIRCNFIHKISLCIIIKVTII